MAIIRSLRLMNALMSGNITGSELETLISSGDREGEWKQLLALRGQSTMLASSETAVNTIMQAPTAFAALVESRVANPIVMPTVAASTTAMNALVASNSYLTQVAASRTAMEALAASTTAMTILAGSRPAMDAIYASPTAIKAIMPSAWGVYAPHTPLLTLDTTNVDVWRNAEGSAERNFTQTSFSRPTFGSTQAVNGYDVLQFAGGQFLQSLRGINSQEYTIFIVYRRENTSNHGLYGDAGSDGITVTGAANVNVANSGTNGGTFDVVAQTAGSWGFSRFRRSGPTSMRHSLNGSVESAARTANLPDFSNEVNYIGQAFDAATAAAQVTLTGQIAEVIILTQGRTVSAEVTRITNMLRTKYGL